MYNQVAIVLRQAWLHGFRTKSNFARDHADEVAIAASLGLISTTIGKNLFDRTWRITRKGMDYLEE